MPTECSLREFRAWKARIEALPYFEKTIPPHWQASEDPAMQLATSAFVDIGVIRREFAFGAIDPVAHVSLSGNRNPDFAWSGLPTGTRSLALAVPRPGRAVARRRRQPGGRIVPASLPRVDFFHWVLVDLPSGRETDRARRASRRASPRAESPARMRPRGARQGINDYTGWFAGDADMAGNYFGYDGPCPPWNDDRASLCLYAVRARCRTARDRGSIHRRGCPQRAWTGHVLARSGGDGPVYAQSGGRSLAEL